MDCMNYTRWIEIKRVMKLNDNLISKKEGEDGYNPAYKYDLIWANLFYNINAITKTANLDQCGDETSWAHAGFSDVISKIFK